MYTIIPINNLQKINELDFDNTDCMITGLNTIAKLIAYENYPIKNKKIAINNILLFLKTLDTMLPKDDDKQMVQISSKVLIDHFTTKHYKRYMSVLKECNIISAVPYTNGTFYEIGQHTMQYRLFNEFVQDELALVLLNINEFTFVTDKTYNKKFVKTIKNIDVDFLGAITAEIKNHKDNNTKIKSLRVRLNTLFSLNNRRFIFEGFKVDRIYHSLSNVSRISRKFITVDGQTFNDVDVKNCQPLLLCYLILSKGLELDANYKFDCETSVLYENFITPDRNRTETKVEMYRTIYFDFKPNSDLAKKFKELYPLTYKSLEILSKSEQELAGMLQNIEACIFNNITPKKSEYYYPLFDSVYFTDIEDCVAIIKEIKNKFEEYNIKPMMTINGETENDTNDEVTHIEETVYVATKSDYKEHLQTILPYTLLSSRSYKINQETILDELVKGQIKKTSDIKLIIKNIIK